MDSLGYREESVSVAFEEVKSTDWAKQVYQPDIKTKWDMFYKKPGYSM
jgi:4-oxalocrotonate tautomerase